MKGQEELTNIPVDGSSVSAIVFVQPSPVVVIALHPWGPLGGSMHDPHPTTVCQVFNKAGCSTVRFNFRSGIGSGESSVTDVREVAAWFLRAHDGAEPLASQVLIVGYSYGSIIGAAAAADIPQCIGCAILGPPLDYSWALYVFNGANLRAKAADSEGKPKLLVVGTSDEFCCQASFQKFVEELPEPKSMVVLSGVNHFSLFRKLPKLLEDWIRAAFAAESLPAFAQQGVQPAKPTKPAPNP